MDFPNSKGSYSELQVANTGGTPNQNTSGFSEETTAFLDSLSPEERQKAMEEINAPLTGEDVAEALKQDADYVPEEADYLKFVAFNKSHESSILDGISAGATAVLNDLGAAVGAVADHPMKALATAPASLIEAFSQGTRNLYGMVAQSADPNSILFGFKNALAGDGSPEGYQQFLEARRFNKHSAALASGEETLVMDKGVIDHDLTLAMSYIADPTLFIPFGAAATAGMRAVGMGEKLAMLSARAQTIKAAVIGGGLKWAVGAPIEAMGSVARGVIDKAATLGGTVLETTTGISAAELKATAKLSAVGTTTSSILGGHLPVISDISNVYIGAGAARGFGEAIGAVGEQIQKQGFKRGYNSFAKEALLQTPNLSAHAKGLLKVLDTLDPLMSYGYGMAEGMAHGAVIGGTLGYLNAGKEGLGHGMGAGIALGGVGALGGRMYADATGGTMMVRAEVRGGFVIEAMRADKHPNLPAVEAILLKGTLAGDRAGALQVIGGLDRIAPDMRLIAENATSYDAILKAKGLNADGHKVDPVTGRVLLGSNGKPIQFEAPLSGFYGGEGFTMMTEKDGNGKQQVTVVINTDAKFKSTNVLHHELFHAVFKTTVMEPMFRERFAEAILGKFDANGVKIKSSEIDPKELKAFVTRELKFKVDPKTNEQITPAQHKALVDEFDAHLAEYQKAGSTAKMNPDSAKSLNDLVEEFGAHYATQFMKGKPVDYLFHGAEYTGMRGVMDRLHNGFLDFWQKNITKQNPTFGDFTGDKTFDKSFGPNKGKRTLAQRSSAIDYMVQDLLRSVAGKSKDSTNSFDVRTLSPEARTAFLNSSGMDGFRHYFDKDGRRRNLTEDQVKAERLAVGKAVHDSLSKLDPKEVAGLKDVEGSFVANSTVGTKFSDTMLAHLVKEGHISDLLAERIRNIQEITSGNGSNVISYLYKGDSMELEVGPNSRRVYGADVPITSRNTIVVGYEIKVKKDGTMSLTMKGLDKNLIDARGNEQWAKPETRDLWQGDRNEFDKSFFEYLSNASKASTDLSRVESSLLPSLARGDGFGAERRNIMHQFLGMAKRKGEKYFNTPIAEIPRGKTSTVFNSRMDLMSPVRSDLPIRYDFNLDNAHSDLSRNYKVSDMEHEATPQGDVFTHASKYKILADKQGAAHLYDADGKMLGAFKDKDLASKAMEKAYTAERVETDKRIERVIADQQKQQQTFKVWDEETIAKGRELGDIFETDAGKAFTHGTELIRQTREEFYSDNFIKLRQADPEAVMQATEQVISKVSRIEALKNKLEDDLYSTKETGIKKAIKRQELMNVSALLQRYNDIRLAYTRATKNGQRNGQVILDYINTHRRTSTGYDNMAKVFFGEEYDAQFQTGKPVTTVATHGTDANELLTSKEFDVNKLGSRHMNPNDRVGVFLSGETKTSFGYAEPKEGEFGYRQVRAAVKFNNPFVLDYGFQCFDGAKYDRIFKQARAGGHDGIVIKNVYDGGSADTVFIVMANKVKENTAIIDTHIGMERVTRKSEQIGSIAADSDQGSVRYPIQESMPRGKGVRIGSDLGLSFKGDDATKMSPQDALKEAAFERVIPTAKIAEAKDAGRYEEGVPITRLAGKSVAVLAYDSAGVLSLADKKSGQAIEGAESFGGGMHSVRSEALGFGHTAIASTLQGVNAIIKVLASVHQKAKLAGEEHYYATILGANPDKLLSSTVGVRASNAHLTQLMARGMLSEKDVRGTLLKISSDKAFPNLGITEAMTTAEMLQSISAIFAKPLDPNAKVTAQSKGSAFKQKTAFVDAIVRGLKSSDSWQANKDGIQKYFGTTESMKSNEGIKRALGLSITDPTNFDKSGNLVKNGHMFLALEFKTGKDIEWSKGGHPSYPNDIRYKDGTPVKILRFEEPMLATDAAGSKEGVDIGNKITVQKGYPKEHPLHGFQQKDANGTPLFVEQSAYTYEVPTGSGTGEMKMKQAADMVHRDPNFNTGKNTAELGLKDLLKFKTRDNAYHSALNKTVENIFTRTVGKDQMINPARLLNLLKSASGGNVGRILTEAKANGLIKMLESQGQKKMPITDIRRYLSQNEIKVTSNADTLRVDADFGSTMSYVSEPWNPSGNKGDNYHTLLLNIAPQYAHGVAGHFDKHSPTGTTGDTIAHARVTVRRDAQGRKVLNVEEIQPQNSNAGVLSPSEKTKAIDVQNRLNDLIRNQDARVIKENTKAKGLVTAHNTLMDSLKSAPMDGDGIDYHLKRIDNWFDQTRSDIPDATPALQAEMMEVVNRGIENYNRNMGSEKVPVGAKSPSELTSKLRMYNPDRDAWIPTYYREAMLKGFEAWAAIVDRITDGKPTALDSINHPELVKLVKAKKDLQQGVSDRTKAELQAKFSKEEMPAAYKDGLINPDYARMKKAELEYSIKKVANDMPLQDFAETTRLMHREVMAKAVELGVDRVTFVQSKDTHPAVQMRNERGAALYDRDIPAMVNGELKKFGTELKPANNIDQSPNYPSSPSHDEHTMLSENLGYDITSQMAEAVAKSQPTYKVSDEQMGSAFIGRVAKENPNITKGMRVEFEKTRSSKFGDEYILRLFKKDKADGGEEIMIGTFNSEVDGNSASSGNAEIKGDFRNKGYGRLMYSEMAERLRALGAESWGGRMIDQARRPQALRERVIDQENARLGYKDSETRLSDERQDYNGEKTFYIESTLHKEAHYKVSDTTPARAEGTPDLKPFEGNFKVSDSVKSGVRTLGKFIDDNSDTANLSPDIKDAMKALREAVRKQDATDEILVPEVREAYDKIVEAVDRGIDTPALTPVAVLKELKKTLKPLNKEISKNFKDTAKRIADKDMAEGADLESDAIQEGKAALRRDMEEGADIESEQALEKRDRQRGDNRLDQEEGADIEAEQAYERRDDYNRDQNESADLESSQPRKPVPSPFPYPAPPTPAGLPSYKPSGKPAFPRPPASPALPQVTPSNKPAFPRPPASPALPRGSIAPPPPQGTPAPDPFKNLPPSKPMGKLEGWRGWTLEKGLNGGFWKNAVGWMIIVQGDKFKVYNPQKAMEGIYNNLEQAKLRVRRAEPKNAITR